MSLFSAFDKEELCQLYVYPSFPNVDAVNSYYRITDRDAIKMMIPGFNAGVEVGCHEYAGSMIENRTDVKFYAKESNNSPVKRIIRDAVWKCSHWYTKNLKRWLDKESPNCIFLAPGYAKFIYDVALKISKQRHIPIITYICDDYYFFNGDNTWLGLHQHRLLQKKTKQIMEKSEMMVAISEEIKGRYEKEFSIDCKLIMTGSNICVANKIFNKSCIEYFSYFGNMDLKREKSLADIGRILDDINQERNTQYALKIYTGRISAEAKTAFDGISSIKLCGFLTGEAFSNTFLGSDCLVHVEAFDDVMIERVRGSISTKIADSLASGIPLLAYAPCGIASMEHLKRNECAFIAHDYESLKNVINQILDDNEKRMLISKNAIFVAKQYHVSSENSIYLKSLVEKALGE